MRRALTLVLVTLVLAGCGGNQPGSGDTPLPPGTGTADPTAASGIGGRSTSDGEAPGGSGQQGPGQQGPGEQGPGEQPPAPSVPPAPPEPSGAAEAAELERLLLLPVDLVAPLACFTEGLATRYVDGYGGQVVDPRPHGEIRTVRVEYDALTRLRMDSDERRVHLLPGSGRPVEVLAEGWAVAVDVHMFLSGGFKIHYSRTHTSTGSFRQQFTSPVDPTCTVAIVYAVTTTPVP